MNDRSSDSPMSRGRGPTSWIAWSAVVIALLGIATVSFSRYRMWQVKAEVESLGGRLLGQELPPLWFEWLVDQAPNGWPRQFVAKFRSQFRRVTFIELHGAKPRPGLLHRLTCFQFLEILDLPGCQIEDDDLAALPRFPQLRGLILQDTLITDASAVHFRKLDKLSLQEVYLSRTAIGDETMTALSRLDSLMNIDVGDTSVSDASLSDLRGLRLHVLILNGTRITDAAISQLGRQPDLAYLHLHGTKITDKTLAALTKSSFPQLENLDVRATNVTSQEIGGLALPQLSALHCDGPLRPADWRRLRKLPKLDDIVSDGRHYERSSSGRFFCRSSGGPLAWMLSDPEGHIPKNEDE